MAISLGGNALVPVAGALLPRWLEDADWRKRHASLICLAQIAEGCQKVRCRPRALRWPLPSQPRSESRVRHARAWATAQHAAASEMVCVTCSPHRATRAAVPAGDAEPD